MQGIGFSGPLFLLLNADGPMHFLYQLFFNYLLSDFFQEIPKEVINQALSANPYNAAAYGLLVFVLMVFSFMNYRDRRRTEKAYYKHLQDWTSLLVRVEEKMSILKDIRSFCLERLTAELQDDVSSVSQQGKGSDNSSDD